MTVMLQSGLDITPGDHPSLRVPRVRGRVRRGPGGDSGKVIMDWTVMTARRPGRRPARSARLPRRRARRAARAPPLPAAAGHDVGAGPDRVGRRPAPDQPVVERLPRADPPSRGCARRPLAAVREFGVGSGAVRTIAGTMTMHEALEAELAAFKGTPAVLTFQSGFTANTGVIPTITGETDLIVSDALNHASIIDGMRLSKAPRKVYPHADVAALREILREARETGRPGGGAVPADPGRDRRRLLDGRRHRAAPRDRRGGRGVRGGRHGRRRPRLGRPRPERPRLGRPLRAARPGRDPGRHAVARRSASLGGYVAGSHGAARDPDPARAAVPLLDVAPAGRRGRLPRGDPGHAGRAGAAGAAVGEHPRGSRPS